MVPETVRPGRVRGWHAAITALGALSLISSGCRRRTSAAAADDTTATARAVAAVRDQYSARDALAAGAWSWTAPDNEIWVLVDVQSTMKDLVEARLDLWSYDGVGTRRLGRSDVMPAAADFAGYAFEDLTGDGIPDFFGAVVDSTGESFPIFIVGAHGAMGDEIEVSARGFQFASGDDNPPQVLSGPHGPCALQLWVEAAPDSLRPEWRYMSIGPKGTLGAPAAAAPACP